MLQPVADRLSPRHFQAIATVVEARTGIRLPPAKQTMVEGRLRRRLRALGLADLGQYGRLLFEEGGLEEEWVHVVDCVTTNKTDFFREPSHFEFLVREALPQLTRGGERRDGLKIWSAAASIGAEAFTTAMVLEDCVKAGRLSDFVILGTDISADVLAEARAAIYTRAMTAPIPPSMRQRYLMESRDPARDEVRIVPELRRRVRFQALNLMDREYRLDRDIDVIFCRNVLIYFDKAVQSAVVSRLVSHLRPGGFLILGHSESMAGGEATGVRQIVPTIFQRNAAAERRAA